MASKLQLHRTKCSKLISNVLAVAMKNEMKKDMVGKKFAVLVDESTIYPHKSTWL